MVNKTEESFSLQTILEPDNLDELKQLIQDYSAAELPVAFVGGSSSLHYGLVPETDLTGISSKNFNQILEYPARDMTVTVEAGVTIKTLQKTLAEEGQQLPIDCVHPNHSTVGGMIAKNMNGPRRLGYGTVRDYVIGIQAVDGRGVPFKGGGKVVKNVAGYDFCKLLTGSLGTLGMIHSATFKVIPIPEISRTVTFTSPSLETIDRCLEQLTFTEASPTSVILNKTHSETEYSISVGFAGTEAETKWQCNLTGTEMSDQGAKDIALLDENQTQEILSKTTESIYSDRFSMTNRISIPSSKVMLFLSELNNIELPHEVNSFPIDGLIYINWSEFEFENVQQILVQHLYPLVQALGGHASVLHCSPSIPMTPYVYFGSPPESMHWMTEVKKQFDPAGILNAGRYWF
jgi:glycolate oxidase FAD binding subunit